MAKKTKLIILPEINNFTKIGDFIKFGALEPEMLES